MVKSDEFTCSIEGGMDVRSGCPLKRGIISTEWGPISIQHVIAGISAGVQRNEVTFKGVLDIMKSKQLLKRNAHPEAFVKNNSIDTVWVATLATHIAHAILNQTSANPVIGNVGYWNDSVLPRAFYLESHTWDMIESDILGGIDGKKLSCLPVYVSNE